MTTLTDSFDAAVLDSFIESDADARNRASVPRGSHVIFVWIDHARPIPAIAWEASAFVEATPAPGSCSIAQGWTSRELGGGVIDPNAPYANLSVLNSDRTAFNDAISGIQSAGHDFDDVMSIFVMQGESPNEGSAGANTRPDLFGFPGDAFAFANVANTSGTGIIGGVAPELHHTTWREDATPANWQIIFRGLLGVSVDLSFIMEACFGRPPGGGPSTSTNDEAENKRRIIQALDGVLASIDPDAQVVDVLNVYVRITTGQPMVFVNPASVGAINNRQLAKFGTVGVNYRSTINNGRWYDLLAREVNAVAATLP